MIKNFSSTLIRGQQVHQALYGTGAGVITSVDERCNKNGYSMIVGNAKVSASGGHVHIVFENGSSGEYSESLLRAGLSYGVVNAQDIIPDSDIEILIQNAEKYSASLDAKRTAESIAFDAEVAALKVSAEYAHLEQFKRNTHDSASINKNIRKALKMAFNGAKFSVKKDGYNTSIISWDSEIARAEVDKIVQPFQIGGVDEKGNRHGRISAFNKVFGGVNYVFTF